MPLSIEMRTSPIAPTRGRLIANETRMKRLREHVVNQKITAERRNSLADKELELRQWQLSRLERQTISRLDHQIGQMRAMLLLPTDGFCFYFSIHSNTLWVWHKSHTIVHYTYIKVYKFCTLD